jgi:CheY-like chemotaxis protein
LTQVLIVDDEPDSRELLCDFLSGAGFSVDGAGNGKEALEWLATHPAPKVILLDLTMPVLDGYGFRAEQLKQPALAGLPVILISGDGTAPDPQGVLKGCEVVRKPLKLDKLVAAIAAHC